MVVEGNVAEVHYDVNPMMWAEGMDPLPCAKGKLVNLTEGQSIVIPVPYIHRMNDAHKSGFSVHAYYPGLKAQKSFDIVHTSREDAVLYLDGGWKEGDD